MALPDNAVTVPKIPELVIPDALQQKEAVETEMESLPGHTLPPRLEMLNVLVMDNATHVAVYFGSYLKSCRANEPSGTRRWSG